jgi:hypothetical protein
MGAVMSRIFISYRHCDPDQELAVLLYEGLRQQGHEVFIDKDIPGGANWVKAIDKHLKWCEFLVVILSEESMISEMVQGEIRRAYYRRKQEGIPALIPVRLGYFGPLDYELDSCLARINYLKWQFPEDSTRVLQEVVAALTHTAVEPAEIASLPVVGGEPQTVVDQRRPLPKIDPRTLSVPRGAIRPNPQDPFYVIRSVDREIEAIAARCGETVVIKAPRQMGKSSLLMRYLYYCRQADKQIAFINLCPLYHRSSTYTDFLSGIAASILRELHLQAVAPLQNNDLTYFIEDNVLPMIPGGLVIAFDEADCILGAQHQSAFFSLLRSWHDNRANVLRPWEHVDLAIVISTEPYLLIKEADRSPFSVAIPVELRPFTNPECHHLNWQYGGPLNKSEVNDLFMLLGGQPYLTRLAYYDLATHRIDYRTLLDTAGAERGPFGEHLRALLVGLHQHPSLHQAMQRIIRYRRIEDDDLYYRLQGAGLVRREQDQIVPANLVYARFFKAML